MEPNIIDRTIAGIRDALYVKRIHFTSRACLLLHRLLDFKPISIADMHCLLLNISYACNAIHLDSGDHSFVTLKDIITYLCMQCPSYISVDDIRRIGMEFSEDRDNEYDEVKDMKAILYHL